MIKILNKVQFKSKENKMRSNFDIEIARQSIKKSKNLKFLLEQRFNWMNNFINENDIGIEVGSGAGFSKEFIKNKNFKISDINESFFLDYKKIDAQDTKFDSESFDYIIASNMIHHVPYPIKFFREMNRVLKKNGRLIIFDAHCSLVFQIVTILMRHEGFDFTVNVWDENKPKSDELNAWHGNIAVSNLIFDNKKDFNNNLGNLFDIEHEELTECFIFLNSGGVTSKTFCIPMNNFFLNILNYIDKLLIKLMPSIFCLGKRIVMKKK
jgi:SAM-dependent methyltransferase